MAILKMDPTITETDAHMTKTDSISTPWGRKEVYYSTPGNQWPNFWPKYGNFEKSTHILETAW